MAYELAKVIEMLKVYHEVEAEAKNFLFISAYPMKYNKEHKVKCAQAVLRAIEEYKKLPGEVRKELEGDKNTNVSKVVELEKLCREVVGK